VVVVIGKIALLQLNYCLK